MDCARQASLSITNSWGLLKFTSIESVIPSNHLIFCLPLLLLPSNFPSIFSSESILRIRQANTGTSASTSVLPINIQDWFPLGWTLDLLAVQRTLKSLLQHHSSKILILWHSALFMVQLSHPYTTNGKTLALTRQTFDGKVIVSAF